jgi:hypothetical protein
MTTGLVVAAAFGTGVVGAHLAAARATTSSQGSGPATAFDDGATSRDDGGATEDGGQPSRTDDGVIGQPAPRFGVVRPVQPGVAAPHARTSGS